jgi:glycosyltransferase involved in cell wall biosynthesis
MVYAAGYGSRPATIALKYLTQWSRTAQILRDEHPDTVFVMTPPVFAALPAFYYAWRHGKQVVLDAHTCAFVLPRWRPFLWLQRILCRRALTTLVTNEHIADVVRSAGGHATIVPDVPVVFPGGATIRRGPTFTAAVICSFTDDEPLPAIFEAARAAPDVRLFVTGDADALPASTKLTLPDNVTLTGFLNAADYGSLVAHADIVIDLTTLDHTMLRGAYEAIYQGVPVIVSDWPVLRDAFPIGAIHVDNTSAAIAAALRRAQRELGTLRAEAQRLRASKLERWTRTRETILTTIQTGMACQ